MILTPKNLSYYNSLYEKYNRQLNKLRGWESFEDITKRISKEDLYFYYITQNHSKENTTSHFKISNSSFDDLLNFYDFHKFKSKQECLDKLNSMQSIIDIIKTQYLIEDKSVKDMCALYNVDENLLRRLFKSNDISKRRNHANIQNN